MAVLCAFNLISDKVLVVYDVLVFKLFCNVELTEKGCEIPEGHLLITNDMSGFINKTAFELLDRAQIHITLASFDKFSGVDDVKCLHRLRVGSIKHLHRL